MGQRKLCKGRFRLVAHAVSGGRYFFGRWQNRWLKCICAARFGAWPKAVPGFCQYQRGSQCFLPNGEKSGVGCPAGLGAGEIQQIWISTGQFKVSARFAQCKISNLAGTFEFSQHQSYTIWLVVPARDKSRCVQRPVEQYRKQYPCVPALTKNHWPCV